MAQKEHEKREMLQPLIRTRKEQIEAMEIEMRKAEEDYQK